MTKKEECINLAHSIDIHKRIDTKRNTNEMQCRLETVHVIVCIESCCLNEEKKSYEMKYDNIQRVTDR